MQATDLIERLVRAFTDDDASACREVIADGAIYHGPPAENLMSVFSPAAGKAAYLQRIAQLRSVLSDVAVSVSAVVRTDDMISCVIEYRGTHRGRYLNVSPTGRNLALLTSNTFRIQDERIVEIWHIPDRYSLLDQMTGVQLRDDPLDLAPAEVVASFPPGSFPECIVMDRDGTMYVTLMFQNQIVRLRPGGAPELFHEFDRELIQGDLVGPSCMVIGSGGELFVNVVSDNGQAQGVWQFSTETGLGHRIAPIPVPAFPNGLAADDRGRLYAADSIRGLIWLIEPQQRKATVWSRDPLLAGRQFLAVAPAANGIQVWNNSVYVIVSDTANLVRVPILSNGSAGLPEIFAGDVPGDDFAVDANGTFYVTTHPYNVVIRIHQDGSRAIVATAEQGVAGCTYARFGVRAGDERNLYVVADGGLLHAGSGHTPAPAIVRLAIPAS
ncbi:MAG: hypothetical protein EPO25_17120 [Gammaproteobacteria bacterium]|nr:MAG: hypothetical protein EPO25_17120 [Gammaproteobacteria bacterium]